MCGRYTLKTDPGRIEKHFGLDHLPPLKPRYNLAPTQEGLVIRPGDHPGTRTAALLRWGLIPHWARDTASLPLLINARSETAATRPAFRDALRHRRCLVPADGFYEWARRDGTKRPFRFVIGDDELFAMAGLWDRWHPPGAPPDQAIETFTILTTAANEVLAPYHDRMPVILAPDFYDDWLNPMLTAPDAIERLLKPCPATHMAAHAVSPRVNDVHNDDPACLDPSDTPEAPRPPDQAPSGQLDLDLGFEA
ncbi:MAG: SOS response-associated peptidase [Verrucomicrobia bacterium]|nr:MAG: SOS response-associated peptidase [Verrucomicrobiota bacterium]